MKPDNNQFSVKSRYNQKDALAAVAGCAHVTADLAMRVYTSRLIGSDSRLVLHGGGNTSVKTRLKDITGEEKDVIFVKGSGWDLSCIEPAGFTGLNLAPLQRLLSVEALSNEEMDNQLRLHRIDSRAPDPSVETLLHACLPFKFVDHTHADSILVLTHQEDGPDRIKEALGETVAVLPYTMSGLPLARAVHDRCKKQPETEAIVIINHGIFTYGDDARSSYEKMIACVDRASTYIESRIRKKSPPARPLGSASPEITGASAARCMQVIRGACALPQPGGGVGRFYAELRQSPRMKEASLSERAPDICRTGVLTPDHTNRTKNTMVYLSAVPDADEDLKPMIKRAVDGFKADYHRYFHQQNEAYQGKHQALDPLPRLFLIRGLGLVALGRTRKAARVAADIGEHTVLAKLLAHALGGYVPIPEKHIFDMEYWRLQQKKIDQTPWPLLQGQIALITGAGGAIGLGVAKQLLAAGAVVVLSDIDRPRLDKVRSILADSFDDTRMESAVLDVTDYPAVEKVLEDISCRVGGIDIVVPNAGIAHVAKIEALDPAVLDRVLAVNLKGTFNLIKASALLFKRQGTGGNIVVISSKNVFDPGASFGAYSASKAGAHQLAKIAAMELAEYGVRVNMVNPDAVFGDETLSSQLWDLIGPERMKSRGLDADGLKAYYRERSLLKTPVLPEHVGNAVVFFASDQTPTTGASLPVDAGVSSAFPR